MILRRRELSPVSSVLHNTVVCPQGRFLCSNSLFLQDHTSPSGRAWEDYSCCFSLTTTTKWRKFSLGSSMWKSTSFNMHATFHFTPESPIIPSAFSLSPDNYLSGLIFSTVYDLQVLSIALYQRHKSSTKQAIEEQNF